MAASSRYESVGARELARRQRDVRQWIGRQVKETRLEAGVGPAALARGAGITTGYLWKIEAGQAHPGLDTLTALGACLGCDLGLRLFPTAGPRLHDRFQAPMIEALLRICSRAWSATPEVPVPAARGTIDLVLTRAADRCTVACECHSELRRLELVLRRAAEKAGALGSRFEESVSTRLLLLRSTATTRAIARAYEASLASAFPGKASDAYAALTSSAGPWPGSTILWARLEAGRAEILDAPPRGVRVGR